jgi:CBS domain-containing protein
MEGEMEFDRKLKARKVKEVMDKNPVLAEVPGNREDALHLFGKYEVSGMPVVKSGAKELVGVITRSDIFENPDEDQLALLMSDELITVEPGDGLEKAARCLFNNRIHGLPVVKGKDIVGVISPTEILEVIAEMNGRSIDRYLAPICVPVYEGTPLPVVMKILCITDARAMPVLNDDGNLVGIVTDGDLFTLSHIDEGVAELDIGIGGNSDEWTWEGLRDVMRFYYATSKLKLPKVAVKEVMVKKVITAFKKSSISCVARKMLDNDVDQLPIVDEENELVGMAYDIDLMRSIYE